MRKLRDKLNNKKGFTLVELIVVIVIILILAAVLVPNVMRYIGQAREAAFQSEASSYLTELQGYVAEHYAKQQENVESTDFDTDASTVDKYTLTPNKNGSPGVSVNVTLPTNDTPGNKNKIFITADKGGISAMWYEDNSQNTASWTQATGWTLKMK